jgi:predicted nucleic acid-binding protein
LSATAAERWVLDASPLIVLARVGLERLPLSLAAQVVVPRPVAEEIQAGPTLDAARQALAAGRFTIVDPPPAPPDLLAWDLGRGETAVLSWAIAETGWTCILDDAEARRCAEAFSVPVKGTLALVLLAKQRGIIPSATEIIQALVGIGFHLDVRMVREVLAQVVGETWPLE